MILSLFYSVGENGKLFVNVPGHEANGRGQIRGLAPLNITLDQALGIHARALGELDRARVGLGAQLSDDDLRLAKVGSMETLKEEGRTLSLAFLSPDIIQFLSPGTQVQHIEFVVDPRLNGIPFEMMFVHGEFLGFRFGVSRRMNFQITRNIPRQSGILPYRGVSILDPQENANGVARVAYGEFQAQWKQELKSQWIEFDRANPAREPVSSATFESLLRLGEIVNHMGHHSLQGGFGMADRSWGASGWTGALRQGDVAPLSFFTLGCDAAMSSGWDERWYEADCPLRGVVDAALRSGVHHFIGALKPVPQLRVQRLFFPYYKALVEGYPPDEALRRARLALRLKADDPYDGGTVLGLLFVLYLHASLTPADSYFCASGHRCGEMGGRLCDFDQGTLGRCGKVLCEQDLGWAELRCPEHRSQPLCDQGHQVIGDEKKRCSDPQKRHPGETRIVCPLCGSGYVGAALCSDCYATR